MTTTIGASTGTIGASIEAIGTIRALKEKYGWGWENLHESKVQKEVQDLLEAEFPGLGEELFTDFMFGPNPLSWLTEFISIKRDMLTDGFRESFHKEFRPVWEMIKDKLDGETYPVVACAVSLAIFEMSDHRSKLFEASNIDDYKRYIKVWRWCMENQVSHHRWAAYFNDHKVPIEERKIC